MLKIFIKTFGCTLNKADSLLIQNILSSQNVRFVDSISDADIVITNTCTVKSLTVKKVLKYLKNVKNSNKKLIVAGCLTYNRELLVEELGEKITILKPQEIQNVLKIIKDISGHELSFYVNSINSNSESNNITCSSHQITSKYELSVINNTGININSLESRKGILPIPLNDGCASNCTFCATKKARPVLKSYSSERILASIKDAILNNVYEIQLTSQDSGAYGLDRKTNLIELLENVNELCEELADKQFRIRLGMMNPVHLKNFYVELAEILKSNEKIYSFLHIPIQSGSNRVLKHMKRQNTVEEFLEITSYLRRTVKDIFIMTDVIVGYPTESESDFEETLELLRKVKPETTNVSKFSPMANTYAAKLKQIPRKEVNKRSKIAAALCKEIEHEVRKKYINKVVKVFVTEKNKTLTGRLQNYIQVALPHLTDQYLGKFINAKILSLNNVTLFADEYKMAVKM
ncbi:MAG: tRNA (N(6)-L-threonylcarbamoyladenosine(37)-C(2))-methylthiotransferase [Candidatus Micrarchaeota archaeon]|nr:tRNA (N(6)-L-threonylcarbamoyladenosine(37)-C(2))-methylthiotransferase [Candidatus Micrarchaeota archaeon]